jgi:hypothetical protein
LPLKKRKTSRELEKDFSFLVGIVVMFGFSNYMPYFLKKNGDIDYLYREIGSNSAF